jgi:hypothetical protein
MPSACLEVPPTGRDPADWQALDEHLRVFDTNEDKTIQQKLRDKGFTTTSHLPLEYNSPDWEAIASACALDQATLNVIKRSLFTEGILRLEMPTQ